ncbi:MAG: hypothetical protein OEX03_12115 [Gammaproteobacteria bacterium]|nr:hypothetical protein [Gammaproteobacteria bacterium]
MTIFVIEDEAHAEWCGEFPTFELALKELEERSKVAWDKEPNKCPCMSWKTCGRNYEIIEFNNSEEPWVEINRTAILEVSENGSIWVNS